MLSESGSERGDEIRQPAKRSRDDIPENNSTSATSAELHLIQNQDLFDENTHRSQNEQVLYNT